jgi:hypothetical protein
MPPMPPEPDIAAPPIDGGESTDTASSKAASTAEAGKRAAEDVAGTASEKAKGVAGETKKQARELVGQARDQLRDQAGTQHRNLVTNLRSLADELDGMAEGGEQSGVATDLVRRASGHTRSAASWLDEREPGDIVDEVRNFARQRPGVFLAAAVMAGVAAGRLTRGGVASHSDDNTSGGAATTGDGPQQTTPYGGSL